MAYNLRSRPFREILVDTEDEVSQEGELSDVKSDNVSEESNENSDAISSESEYEDAEPEESESRARGRPSKVRGKNGFEWNSKAPSRRSDRVNAPIFEYGPSGAATNCTSMAEYWQVLFTNEMINMIVEHTNDKIEDVCSKMISQNQNIQTYHHITDEVEIKAFIGLLYYSGAWKSSNVNLKYLWDSSKSQTMYRCVMPYRRFEFLLACIRFDKKESRDANDHFAPIRNLWDKFMANCESNYTPSSKCTVDEQLLGFRGRCRFRMYIKSKPDKYGIKIVTLNDAQTCYLIIGVPYLRKTSVNDESICEYFFREVTKPIHGTGRTVTCNNWFTTIPLLMRMLEPEFNLTMTGTIRKNKREIPEVMKTASKNPPASNFCFTNSITLVSHTSKKHKLVLLVSSYIHTENIVNNKPEIILHYNDTKGGTDSFDQLCHTYTVSRRTLRWSMRIFFGMLDQAAVNARIMLNCTQLKEGQKPAKAFQCLESLFKHLLFPYLTQRYTNRSLRKPIILGIQEILKIDRLSEPEQTQRPQLDKRVTQIILDAGVTKTPYALYEILRYVCALRDNNN
ncbi:PREDICTED: uncharacterized protein LOC108783160 [Cyphomyrmex costatus]|uniref:uncharacterized protein LOC108783160 n=1 Tax=Cyphomyrmex costatus TaxID=456900 RepID=UPI0008521D0C|nr:PREDICTED: uncharacterized protein LOC108783160 [Cyphomyrmex costatus]